MPLTTPARRKAISIKTPDGQTLDFSNVRAETEKNRRDLLSVAVPSTADPFEGLVNNVSYLPTMCKRIQDEAAKARHSYEDNRLYDVSARLVNSEDHKLVVITKPVGGRLAKVFKGAPCMLQRKSQPSDSAQQSYSGRVKSISGSDFCLRLDLPISEVEALDRHRFTVSFEPNARLYVKLQQAVESVVKNSPGLLFPEKTEENRSRMDEQLCEEEEDVLEIAATLNPEQAQAAEQIMRWRCGKAPYVLFGPPGTGKTGTLAKIFLSLLDLTSEYNKLLVCAPSNTATDNLHRWFSAEVSQREAHGMRVFSYTYLLTESRVKELRELRELPSNAWTCNAYKACERYVKFIVAELVFGLSCF